MPDKDHRSAPNDMLMQRRRAFCEICGKETEHRRTYRAALWSCEFADQHPASLQQKYEGTIEELRTRLKDADTYLDERLNEAAKLRGEVARIEAMLPGPEHLCTGGWVNIQHPMKPPGVTISTAPCPICNEAGDRVPYDPQKLFIPFATAPAGDPQP